MRYVRFVKNDLATYGELLSDNRIQPLDNAPYLGGKPSGDPVEASAVRLVAPCEPSKIVAIGKNYYDHIQEFDSHVPESPIIFFKPPTAVNDPQAPIYLPSTDISNRIDYEGELALVISRTAFQVKAADAANYIQGYTILNDVTARDVQKADGQWARAKGMDGFSPIGPLVTDEIDPYHLALRTRLNGRVVQESNTEMQIWNIAQLIEFITSTITLLPGDIVSTGTPAGVGPMVDGDTVEIEIEGIGVLQNKAVAR